MYFSILLLAVGVVACSTSIIFIRLSHLAPALVASYRLMAAGLVLAPLFVRDFRKRSSPLKAYMGAALAPGLLLGVHFMSWAAAVRMTPAVNASLLGNLSPVALPFFLYRMFGEHLTRRELLGTAVAVGGVLALSAADFNLSRAYFRGDACCFVSMLFFVWYLALGRRNRSQGSIWLYVPPLYLVAGVFSFMMALFLGDRPEVPAGRELALVLCMALIPTVLGHSILNLSMGRLKGQVVGMFTMTQFIFTGLLAYWLWNEIPRPSFFVGGALVLCGTALVVTQSDPAGFAASRAEKI